MPRSAKQIRALVKPPRPLRSGPRSPEESLRINGSVARIEWVQAQPSVASGKTPCVNAHYRTVANSGMGYKPDARHIVPLTKEEHDEIHQHGQASFEAKYGISLEAMAAQTEQRWQAHVAHQQYP